MAHLDQHEKKRRLFGQHFLVDKSVIESIALETITQIKNSNSKKLLEIGPGKGAITNSLIEKIKALDSFELILAEKDFSFIKYWKEKNIPVLEGDFLDHDDTVLDKMGNMTVVSNLPYSTGTAIVNRLLTRNKQIPAMILMFQAEVAQRFRAEPKSRDFGSLSLWSQNFWEIKKLITVKPTAFKPPPKVNSEVIVFTARNTPLIPETLDHIKTWQELIKTAFRHKRKMLRSNFNSTPFESAFLKSKVASTLRAEQLGWDQWREIFLNCI